MTATQTSRGGGAVPRSLPPRDPALRCAHCHATLDGRLPVLWCPSGCGSATITRPATTDGQLALDGPPVTHVLVWLRSHLCTSGGYWALYACEHFGVHGPDCQPVAVAHGRRELGPGYAQWAAGLLGYPVELIHSSHAVEDPAGGLPRRDPVWYIRADAAPGFHGALQGPRHD